MDTRIGPYVRFMLPDRAALMGSVPNHVRAADALRRRDGQAAREAICDDIRSCAIPLRAYLMSGPEL